MDATGAIGERGAGVGTGDGERVSSVVSRTRLGAPAARVWDALLFYEQIPGPPPLHLRWLLPVPIGTEGHASEVGREARCLYEGGHLKKRVTRIEPGRHYAFDVVEQALDVGGGITLSGGSYTLEDRPDGGTDVRVETRYVGTRRPRWLCEPIEAAVCRSFHRYLLRSMQKSLGGA